jgi:hypothetical protein
MLRRKVAVFELFVVVLTAVPAIAQTPQSTGAARSHWHVMQDAIITGMFNHQGGPRGGDEFRVPNWWMGMFSRKIKSSNLSINTMFSLDPLTVSKKGYREIFQVGETYKGEPLIDYQHPHDVFMQLAAVVRTPVDSNTTVTIAGAPSGEPALGPVAFMHRASAIDNPMAPLSHHIFDSSHIAFGVVTAAVDHGRWTIEGSLFNGREPDEDRWDFDFGPLDSASVRLWFRPREEWEFQASSGYLRNPDELEPGNIVRTTTSGSWLKRDGDNFTAAMAAYAMNVGEHTDRSSFLIELTRRNGMFSWYGRGEIVEVESGTLLKDESLGHAAKDAVGAFTLGAVRELPRWNRLELGVGAGVTFYAVPTALKQTHGERPVSFQIFLRLRPRAGAMGRMWNMHMIKPMHPATDPHAGHM